MALKPVFITARDIPDVWYQLIRAAVEQGREYSVTKGSTPTKRWNSISCPLTSPIPEPGLWSRTYRPASAFPIRLTRLRRRNLPYFMTDIAEPGEHYHGEDLAWQIDWVIDYYKQNGPGTKHCYMTVGRPESLRYYDESVDYEERIVVRKRDTGNELIRRDLGNAFNRKEPGTTQCLRGVDTAIKYGKLHLSIHFRSWNLWNGLPANLACLQMVKEYMAEQIGVEDGEMFITCLKLGLADRASISPGSGSTWKKAPNRPIKEPYPCVTATCNARTPRSPRKKVWTGPDRAGFLPRCTAKS